MLDRFETSIAFLSTPVGVFILIALTALLIIATDWRITVAGIGMQSVVLAVLATRHSPFEWAMLRMLTGGLIAIMWYLSAHFVKWGSRPIWWLSWRWPPLSAYSTARLVMVVFTVILLLVARPWLYLSDIDSDLGLLCTWLVVMGILALALSNEVLTAGVGLIWWLEAFHLYYPTIEHNVVIEGTVGVIKLMVGMACAYLIVAQNPNLSASREKAR
jgi:hypothetical protein